MTTSACPSCGHTFPVPTRAMHSCPNCGRPIQAAPPRPGTTPPPWLDREDVEAPADPTSPGHGHAVRADHDPLAGWDVQSPPPRVHEAPADWLLAICAIAAGVAVGGIAAPGDRRGRGAVVGALLGLGSVVAVRRMWTIEPPDASWTTSLGRTGATRAGTPRGT